MEFDVSIQGRFYKKLTASNTGTALAQVIKDIAANAVPKFNPNLPHNIVITPPTPDPFDPWMDVAPQNPRRFDVWMAPDESEWIYDQPRDSSGRYVADNPDTLQKESALRWVRHTYVNSN